jgi:hypothetical protein
MNDYYALEKERYTTLDVYEAAFFLMEDIEPELLSRNGKVIFYYDTSPELLSSMGRYRSGGMVSAQSYAQAIKHLKGRIFAKKEKFQ